MTGRRQTVVEDTDPRLHPHAPATAVCGSGAFGSANCAAAAGLPSSPTSRGLLDDRRGPLLLRQRLGWSTILVLALAFAADSDQLILPGFSPGLSTTHRGFTT